MAEIVTHSFVSAKTQSPDTTLVSKNEWNDGHLFSGGANGQILIYDNTQDNNVKWVDGPSTTFGSITVGATASPYTTGIIINITPSSNAAGIISVFFSATTSGGASYGVTLKINTVDQVGIGGVASGTPSGVSRAINFAAGSYNFTILFTASAGTFLSVFAEVSAFTVGKV